MKNVNYDSAVCPSDYKCSLCGKHSVKLWREYQTVNPELFCANCSAQNQSKDISSLDSDGLYITESGVKTDQIGWCVPAIPDEEGIGYWGYSSVPQSGINWWRKLPN
jgi:DNA-directed RNA polymerase subunit RPC12/RpoP